jgi:hypothetical protein
MLNDLNIASVHVHQGSLLLVVGLPAGKTRLENSNRIRELSGVFLSLRVNAFGFGSFELRIIALRKLLL